MASCLQPFGCLGFKSKELEYSVGPATTEGAHEQAKIAKNGDFMAKAVVLQIAEKTDS